MTHRETVIGHIASFTEIRDQELLNVSLLKSIKSLMSASKVIIVYMNIKNEMSFKIGVDNDHIFKSDHTHESDIQILDTIESMRLNSKRECSVDLDTGSVFVKQLYEGRFTTQYLTVFADKPLEESMSHFLRGMFSVYNNFLTLLKDSQTDELTGLANRKTFEMEVAKLFDNNDENNEVHEEDDIYGHERRSSLSDQPDKYWLAIIDIDNFKTVNDSFGHLYGDEILIQLAQIMRKSFRDQDRYFRFGGEEFVVILNAKDQGLCSQAFDRFRRNVADHKFPQVEQITVSIGTVQIKKDVFTITLIDYADQALYHAKRTGKNKIILFEDMMASGIAKEEEFVAGTINLF